MNPQVVQALEKMAANDPNEGLRSRAGRWLDELHEEWVDIYAKGILRKREQEKEKAASDSPKP